jgi:hypothetical protein
MEGYCNIKQNIEYQGGYSDGFKDGMNKAMECIKSENYHPKR